MAGNYQLSRVEPVQPMQAISCDSEDPSPSGAMIDLVLLCRRDSRDGDGGCGCRLSLEMLVAVGKDQTER